MRIACIRSAAGGCKFDVRESNLSEWQKKNLRSPGSCEGLFPGTGTKCFHVAPVRRLKPCREAPVGVIDPETTILPELCSDPGGRPATISRKMHSQRQSFH